MKKKTARKRRTKTTPRRTLTKEEILALPDAPPGKRLADMSPEHMPQIKITSMSETIRRTLAGQTSTSTIVAEQIKKHSTTFTDALNRINKIISRYFEIWHEAAQMLVPNWDRSNPNYTRLRLEVCKATNVQPQAFNAMRADVALKVVLEAAAMKKDQQSQLAAIVQTAWAQIATLSAGNTLGDDDPREAYKWVMQTEFVRAVHKVFPDIMRISKGKLSEAVSGRDGRGGINHMGNLISVKSLLKWFKTYRPEANASPSEWEDLRGKILTEIDDRLKKKFPQK